MSTDINTELEAMGFSINTCTPYVQIDPEWGHNSPIIKWPVLNIFYNDEHWHSTEYRMGLGHLTARPKPTECGLGVSALKIELDYSKQRKRTTISDNILLEELNKRMHRQLPPSLGDILYSLTMDATEETFPDWCDEYDFDTDSRKALKTYEACVATGQAMRKLPPKVREQLEELMQEY